MFWKGGNQRIYFPEWGKRPSLRECRVVLR